MEWIAREDRSFGEIREDIDMSRNECYFRECILFSLNFRTTGVGWFTNHRSFAAIPRPVWNTHMLLLSRAEEQAT